MIQKERLNYMTVHSAKTDGTFAPTLTSSMGTGGGHVPMLIFENLRICEATKQGYAEATVGDYVNLEFPTSKTRRGRVGKQVANTLLTSGNQGVVVLRPVRTKYGKEIRKAYENGEVEESRHNMTKLEPRQDGISNTITTVQKDNLLKDGVRIRKLTPRECWRLQGFPDWAFDKAQEVNSKTQLYKQAGNGVTVNVIKAIAERLEQ